jgi:hypothetical protein
MRGMRVLGRITIVICVARAMCRRFLSGMWMIMMALIMELLWDAKGQKVE